MYSGLWIFSGPTVHNIFRFFCLLLSEGKVIHIVHVIHI